jgi:hypothetical protein
MAINIGAYTNASIHRYISLTRLLHPASYVLESRLLKPLMFFIQFVWPLIGTLFCTKIPFRSENALRANAEVSAFFVNFFLVEKKCSVL